MRVVLFNPATDDLARLASLHLDSFETPWDAATLAGLLASPGTFAYHHEDGFVLARAAAGEAEILTLAVSPAGRGKGLGRALVIAAANRSQELGAGELFLEVGTANPAALALYAGLGFAQVGTRKGYYDKPRTPQTGQESHHPKSTDAVVLRLPLPAKFA
ncbi:MAG TPA: GNAT family N-acetyltransferase [Rhizomicrobium sp.]|jgi:ribosomal-protein-alanine N-acetyltransferase|nr:GNAT family N-acetyltransferase [Rhizomicrobium sp.]